MARRDGARRLNERLIAHMEVAGALREPAVAGAFRAVLRHHFLPGRPLEEVYEDSAIMTKLGEHGAAVSSSSQPSIMAVMLQQLRPGPGQRVLEIGAGTGYNAALLAHLAGPHGRVTTLDLDEELCRQARANLAAAGVEGVEVVHADGAGGWPAGAPYDRVMATASAADISPAWLDQLVEGGRLVLPLALAGPAQLSAAFVRHGRVLAGDGLTPCSFMPLRGAMAVPGPEPDERLSGWLAGQACPAGESLPVTDRRVGFETWLALTQDGYVRAWLERLEVAAFGLRDDRGVAFAVDGGRQPAVVTFGEGGDAARTLVELWRAWAAAPRGVDDLRVTARPAGEEPAAAGAARVIRRPHFTFTVTGP